MSNLLLLVLLSGAKVPAFRARTLDQKVVLSKEIFNGKRVVLMDFWAIWCRECKTLMPKLQALKKKFGDQLEIVAVNLDSADRRKEVVRHLRNGKYDFLVLLDPGQKLKRLFGVRMVPTTFLVSPEGRIVRTFVGAPRGLERILEKEIARLVAKLPKRKPKSGSASGGDAR